MRSRRLWLCLPVVVFSAADGLFTLYGQPHEYWSNGFKTIREGNPIAAWLLGVHPLAFALSAIPYLAVIALAVVSLPRYLGAAIALCVAVAHAFAVGWWCFVLFERPLSPAAVVILVLIGATTAGLKMSTTPPGPDLSRP
jgi:uncharacterized protein DUF5658